MDNPSVEGSNVTIFLMIACYTGKVVMAGAKTAGQPQCEGCPADNKAGATALRAARHRPGG
jgi:hypothetical protein